LLTPTFSSADLYGTRTVRLTRAVNEGPVVFGLAGAHAGVESRLGTGGQTGQGGRSRDRGLEGPAVGPLNTLASARVTGVGAPAATWLVQTLPTCSVPGTVFRCTRTNHSTSYK